MISCSIEFFSFSIAIGISIRVNVSLRCISCIYLVEMALLLMNSYLYI